MKLKEIRDKRIEEIEGMLADAREELMNFRFQQVNGQLTDPSRLRLKRREIARMLTVLKERQAEGEGGA